LRPSIPLRQWNQLYLLRQSHLWNQLRPWLPWLPSNQSSQLPRSIRLHPWRRSRPSNLSRQLNPSRLWNP
jgi:hypothetical protein